MDDFFCYENNTNSYYKTYVGAYLVDQSFTTLSSTHPTTRLFEKSAPSPNTTPFKNLALSLDNQTSYITDIILDITSTCTVPSIDSILKPCANLKMV